MQEKEKKAPENEDKAKENTEPEKEKIALFLIIDCYRIVSCSSLYYKMYNLCLL